MKTPMRLWVAGARPRTLPAAVVPVAVGTAVGYVASGHAFVMTGVTNGRPSVEGVTAGHHFSAVNALLALVVALGLQIGTNYVNDYADGERGTDEVRVGPVRLVAGRLATVRQVKTAALVAFGVSGVAGLILAVRVTLWFIPIGLLVRPRRLGLHRGQTPLRLSRVGRAPRLRLLRSGGHLRIGLRAARRRATAFRGRSRCGRGFPSGCSPPRSYRRTTSAT